MSFDGIWNKFKVVCLSTSAPRLQVGLAITKGASQVSFAIAKVVIVVPKSLRYAQLTSAIAESLIAIAMNSQLTNSV